jgi:hypothetical protein
MLGFSYDRETCVTEEVISITRQSHTFRAPAGRPDGPQPAAAIHPDTGMVGASLSVPPTPKSITPSSPRRRGPKQANV